MTVFVVNPKAGQGKNIPALLENIRKTGQRLETEVQIYLTQSVGDAERFVREYCKEHGKARFIACGGDGTLSEVLNGAADCEGAEIGVMPCGTGNDFCRNFPEGQFQNVAAQLQGDSVFCDAIGYHTELAGETRTGYCINMVNIGFDCNVADMTAHMKQKPFVSGSMAYFLSIFAVLIQNKGADLRIEIDGEVYHEGPLLLSSVANGCYCGGGIKSNPLASVQDGKININIIREISRLKVIRILPHYMKGDFLELSGIENIISSVKCDSVCVTPLSGDLRISNDGEIIEVGKTEFHIVPKAFRFVVPKQESAEHAEKRNLQTLQG